MYDRLPTSLRGSSVEWDTPLASVTPAAVWENAVPGDSARHERKRNAR